MKVMAIDLGDARTGIAVSDAMGWLTGFTTVIHSWNKDKTAQEIAALVKTHRPERIVMGFPRNMDGSEGRARIYTGSLRRCWRNFWTSRSSYGMRGERRLKPIRSCQTAAITEKSARIQWMRWLRR